MDMIDWFAWRIIIGLGCMWLGGGIFIVKGLPRQLKRGPQPTAAKGTPEAFGLFWLDQYCYIGLTLLIGGAALVAYSLIAGQGA
jgi:hypothetical protein